MTVSNDMPDKTRFIESLAEARLTVLYLARRAVEAKDKKTADRLDAQGREIKAQIAALRAFPHENWASAARGLGEQFEKARARLGKITAKMNRDKAALQNAARALGALDDLLALAKKISV
jgi:hypothetical protein